MSEHKYVLLIERPDLGLQNFAPGSGLLTFGEVRNLIAKSHAAKGERGLPEDRFYIAAVAPEPLTGRSVGSLWEKDAELRYMQG